MTPAANGTQQSNLTQEPRLENSLGGIGHSRLMSLSEHLRREQPFALVRWSTYRSVDLDFTD